ncbi:LLM class flavin-dependent oxidoreductase [Streptomyces sp. SID8352]|uniref:LLM class flavin-dependent oxidoreductase n=1 Tax=Streptomyces sp. SID8352 TaxID=2690338 RepID=UPI00136A5C21|nr:LLM class flavin-dependent oxidoreductase [Streptomyces sp. SID8352]MYU21977.1 LLM class flavin-dependent oxidoreductase [Streptomyces sp. SID8352]
MKFGILYEMQSPRPWDGGSDQRKFAEALDQIELADRIGIDYVWAVEHHFLEEYSHSSAPEVLLGAVTQRTKNIRLGHGITLTSPRINHPARLAERISTLDVLSGGRVEWGTGEGSTAIELEAFGIPYDEKRAMWEEGAREAANMMALDPYPGCRGAYFTMPCRSVVPKPLQRPHPPMWLACARRESIRRAALNGLGALVFGFVEPEEAAGWVREYYDIIRSDACVPAGHTVNANVAALCGFSVHEDGQVAVGRVASGFGFFGYGLGHVWTFGEHRPGRTDLWGEFKRAEERIPFHPEQGAIGDPATVTDQLARYERAGVDQVILLQAVGHNRHEHICESLELFGRDILPPFRARDVLAQARKDESLEGHFAAARDRRARLTRYPRSEDIPVIRAAARQEALRDRLVPPEGEIGGGLPMLHESPGAARPGQDSG